MGTLMIQIVETKPCEGMTFCDCCGCGYQLSQVPFHVIEIKSLDRSICDGCWPLRSVDLFAGANQCEL